MPVSTSARLRRRNRVPRSRSALHQGLDHGGHGIGLRSFQRAAGAEAVGFVQNNHHACDGSGRNEDAEEFPALLFFGVVPIQ